MSGNETDDAYAKRLSEAIVSEKLSAEKYLELTGKAATTDAKTAILGAVRSAVSEAVHGTQPGNDMAKQLGAMLYQHGVNGGGSEGLDTSARIGGLSTMKLPAKHFKSGAPVNYEGSPVTQASQLEKFKLAVFFRAMACKALGGEIRGLDSTERDVLNDLIFSEKEAWAGLHDGREGVFRGSDLRAGYNDGNLFPAASQKSWQGGTKAILDDTLSGGSYINPVWLDEALVTSALLHGELMPYVDLKTMPYGSTVSGGLVTPPAATWGTAEGTAHALVATSGIIGQIASTVFTCAIFLELGLDMLSDTTANLGDTLQTAIGERFAAELDSKIAAGNGTTEPQGIANASGIVTVTSENGVGGPATVGDYEELAFAIGKQYRTPEMRPAYISNDTTFGRSRGIAVGPMDERRVFGMDHAKYETFTWPHRISNDLGNSTILFGALSRYRLWQRMGFQFRIERGGLQLASKNTCLLIGRRRAAGRVVDGSAWSKMTTAEQ